MQTMNPGQATQPLTYEHGVYPDERGRFGLFGGRYVPESLMAALAELEQAYAEMQADPRYHEQIGGLLKTYVGRPTPLYRAERLSHQLGISVYLKREDLAH